jgi:uncharacterized protein
LKVGELTGFEESSYTRNVSTSNEAVPSLDSTPPSSPATDTAPNQMWPATLHPVIALVVAGLLWFASLLLQLIIPALFIIPYAFQRGLSPSSPDFAADITNLALKDPTGILLQIVAIFPAHLLTVLLVWIVVTRFGRRPFLASFGWSWSRRWGPLEALGLVVLGVVLFFVGGLVAKLLGSDKPTELEKLITSSWAARYAIAALAVFTAPFVEEFVYRGVVYSALQKLLGKWTAIIFVVLLFTGIHIPQYKQNIGVISAVALLSIVLTIVRAYSNRLLPCVIIHMAFNAVQAVLLVIEPYFHRSVPTPDPTVPTTIILPLVRLIF